MHAATTVVRHHGAQVRPGHCACVVFFACAGALQLLLVSRRRGRQWMSREPCALAKQRVQRSTVRLSSTSRQISAVQRRLVVITHYYCSRPAIPLSFAQRPTGPGPSVVPWWPCLGGRFGKDLSSPCLRSQHLQLSLIRSLRNKCGIIHHYGIHQQHTHLPSSIPRSERLAPHPPVLSKLLPHVTSLPGLLRA